MDNLGRTLDNTHIGDVLITEDLTVEGDVEIDGSLVFASIAGAMVETDKLQTLTPGGDLPICDSSAIKAMSILNTGIVQIGQVGTEYKMPIADGSPGELLVTDGAGSVSFASGAVGEARVVQNKFTTNFYRTSFTKGVFESLQSSGSGSLSVIDASEFPLNSSYRMIADGNWTINAVSPDLCLGKFRVKFGTAVYDSDTVVINTITQNRIGAGTFQVIATVTNIGGGFINLEFSGHYSLINVAANQILGAIPFSAPNLTPVSLAVPAFPIVMSVDWQDNSSGAATCRPQGQSYYIDYMNPTTSILATTTPGGTLDHTALINLNAGAGDGGHDRMVLDIGRAGGQDMHGGTAAGENLTFDSTTDVTKGSIIMYSDLVMSSKDVTTVANLDTSGVISQSANSAVNVDFTTVNTLQLNSDSLIEIKGTNVVRLNVGSTNKLTVGLTAIVLDENTQLVNSELKLVGASSINMNGNGITSLLDPVLAQDAASKIYVDGKSVKVSPTTLLVVPVSGNDGTGVKGDASKPFLTLKGAYDAALDGDTILCYPGSLGAVAFTMTRAVNIRAAFASSSRAVSCSVSNVSINYAATAPGSGVSISGINFGASLSYLGTNVSGATRFAGCTFKILSFAAGSYTGAHYFDSCLFDGQVTLNDAFCIMSGGSSTSLHFHTINSGVFIVNSWNGSMGYINHLGGVLEVNAVHDWVLDGGNNAILSNVTTGVPATQGITLKDCQLIGGIIQGNLQIIGTTLVFLQMYNSQITDANKILTGSYALTGFRTQWGGDIDMNAQDILNVNEISGGVAASDDLTLISSSDISKGTISLDGILETNDLIFTASAASSVNNWNSVAWSPSLGLFCAVAAAPATNTVMTSVDGITWINRTAAQANNWQAVTWSPELGIFCAVANSGASRVMTSVDGIAWLPKTASQANAWQNITWSPSLGLFCAVAAQAAANQVMTSVDGTTWLNQTAAVSNSWYGITWSPALGMFCAVSGEGGVMTSVNGSTWLTQAAAEPNFWIGLTWSQELGLFVATSITGTNRVMTSPNGTAWSPHPASEVGGWVSVTWSPQLGLFCSISNGGPGNRVMTSPDGSVWTSRVSSEQNNWTNITWSPELGLFASVAITGANQVMIGNSKTIIENGLQVSAIYPKYDDLLISGDVQVAGGLDMMQHQVTNCLGVVNLVGSCGMVTLGVGNDIFVSSINGKVDITSSTDGTVTANTGKLTLQSNLGMIVESKTVDVELVAGANVVLNPTGIIDCKGNLNLNNNNLLSVGSSTATTSFYEYYTETPTWSGPFAVPLFRSYFIVKVGRSVTYTMLGNNSPAVSVARIILDTAIPVRFRPTTSSFQAARLVDGASVNVDGYLDIKTTGIIEMGVGSSFAAFNGTNAGWAGLTCSWITA